MKGPGTGRTQQYGFPMGDLSNAAMQAAPYAGDFLSRALDFFSPPQRYGMSFMNPYQPRQSSYHPQGYYYRPPVQPYHGGDMNTTPGFRDPEPPKIPTPKPPPLPVANYPSEFYQPAHDRPNLTGGVDRGQVDQWIERDSFSPPPPPPPPPSPPPHPPSPAQQYRQEAINAGSMMGAGVVPNSFATVGMFGPVSSQVLGPGHADADINPYSQANAPATAAYQRGLMSFWDRGGH